MKKLLLSLCSIAIVASSMTVTSCSLVNNHKQSVKNKVKNLTNVSEVLLRSAIIEDVTTQNNNLGVDANELHNMIKASKANKLIPEFNTAPQTTIDSLGKSYFGESNNFSKDNIKNKKTTNLEFKDKARNSSTPADSYTPIINSLLTVLNASGGVTPDFAGLLEGFLPMLSGMLPDDASSLSDEKMYESGTAQAIYDNAELIGAIINFLGNNTTLVQDIITTFLSINFFDALKTDDKNSIIDQVLNFAKQSAYLIKEIGRIILNNPSIIGLIIDLIVNNIIKIGFENTETITNGMIMNAAVKRLNNTLADLTGLNQYIDTDYNKAPNYKFNQNLGLIFEQIFKGNINTSKVSSHIIDIIYIISAILHTISSVNFEDNQNIDNYKNIFDPNKDTRTFLRDHKKKYISSNQFKSSIFVNNLSLALKPTENGYDLQKLISLLFYSEGNTARKDKQIEIEKPGILGWVVGLVGLVNNLTGDNKISGGLSPILYGIGEGLAKHFNIKLNILNNELGPNQVANLLTVVFDLLSLNMNLSGIPSLIDFFKTFIDIPISLSETSEKQLVKAFNALYAEDSVTLSELTGIQGLSFYSLFSNAKIGDKLLSDLLKELADALSGAEIDKKRFIYENKSNQITNGLKQISFALSPSFALKVNPTVKVDKHNLIYGDNIKEDDYQDLTGLQTMIYASKYSGLKIEGNENLKGAKAAMYGLGVNENGKEFRENTLLNGLQLITTDKAFESILKQAIDGFSKVNNDKNEFISKNFIPYIQPTNFKTKAISNSGIDQDSDAYISYKIIYKDPSTKKTYEYKVELELPNDPNKKDWQLKSINRI